MKFKGKFVNEKGEKVNWWFEAPSEQELRNHLDQIGWKIISFNQIPAKSIIKTSLKIAVLLVILRIPFSFLIGFWTHSARLSRPASDFFLVDTIAMWLFAPMTALFHVLDQKFLRLYHRGYWLGINTYWLDTYIYWFCFFILDFFYYFLIVYAVQIIIKKNRRKIIFDLK